MSAIQNAIREETRGRAATDRLLLDIATPRMFGRNAFRVTGLAVDAPPREIKKTTDTLTTYVNVGKQADIQQGALSLPDPPTVDQIREAVQTLRDPERRVIDEFFWFWPRKFGESKCDPAIKALEGNDATSAFKIWSGLENSPEEGPVAMHNIAVLRQLMAIEWENHYVTNEEFNGEQRQEVAAYWRDAFKRWDILRGNDLFWQRFTGRIQQLDDLRLTKAFAQCFREELPIAVGKINAELALGYFEQGRTDLAMVHTRLMRETSQEDRRFERTAEVVLGSATSRLRQHIAQAKNRATEDVVKCLGAAGELLDQAGRPIALYELFFSRGSKKTKEFSDEIAEAAYQLLARYYHATKDKEGCAGPFARAMDLATSSEVRKNINDFLQVVNPGRALASEGRISESAAFSYSGDDGSSAGNAIFIKGATQKTLVRALRSYVEKHYPSHRIGGRSLNHCDGKVYDIIKLIALDGRELKVYFDVTEYFPD